MHTNKHGRDDPNFPDTLRVTVESPEAAVEAAVESAAAAEAGAQTDAVVSVADFAEFRQLFTDERVALIRSLMDVDAESIAELATRVDRSYSVVHEDLEILSRNGIVHFREAGQRRVPYVPYSTVKFDLTLTNEGL